MDYEPLNGDLNEIRLLAVFPPTINYSMEDRFSEPIRCTLEHFSLDDIKPGEQLVRSESRSLARRENALGLRAMFCVPSFIFATSFAAVLLLLYVLHRLGLRVPFRWLALLCYILFVSVRAALGEDVSDAWQRAYQRRYFNRFWSLVLNCLWTLTGLTAIYLTFTTWRTAVIALIAGAFQDRLAAYLLRALQLLNFDMAAILLAEQNIQIPDSRKFRFVWGDYLALSYVWGDPDAATMRDIIVNGNVVMVRGNLEAALRRIRGTPEVYFGLKL